MILNARNDLEALRGTPDFGEALRLILGATKTWVNRAGVGDPPAWEEVTVLDGLERMELTMEELLEELAAAGIAATTAPAPSVPLPLPPPVPESITRRQCALQLLAINQITAQEALDMTKTAAVPAAIAAIFDGQVASGKWTPEQRIRAEIDFAATNYYRSNSLLGLMGLTEQEIDGFFIAAVER